MERGGVVYILTNVSRTVLYIGVTSNLPYRLIEHREMKFPNSFTNKYKAIICIYYQVFTSIEEAIDREKQLKKWRRDKKESLINTFNPKWKDLWDEIQDW